VIPYGSLNLALLGVSLSVSPYPVVPAGGPASGITENFYAAGNLAR
jgi:hypothetical protein